MLNVSLFMGTYDLAVRFYQIGGFSGEIAAYQELFRVVTLLASSAQPQWWRKRENKKSNRLKNS